MRKNFGFLSLLRNLAKNEDGNVLLYFAALVPVTMGMIGLVLEGGAFYHLNSDLQELADAAAIAGATELDGASDAITRATDRAQDLLSNDPHWSNVTSSGLQITTPTFYSALDPVNGDTVTTVAAQARFIKVTTVTREVAPAFLSAVGATVNAQTSTSAVAGSQFVACNVQPLMLCNPNELPGGGGTDFSATPGQMFIFTPKNAGSTTFAPGDFGLVDPPGVNTNSGANATRNLLAQTTANFCYVNNLSPRPGNVAQKVQDGINVRFDMAPNGNGNQAGLDKSPAPDVIKGHVPNRADSPCGQFTDHPELRLPPDVPGGMTSTAGVQIGNGVMDATAKSNYWVGHHGPGTSWPAGVTTRYAAYQQELGMTQSSNWTGEPSGTVSPAPLCNGVAAGDFTRRLISVAVVNCLAQGVQGNQNTSLLSTKYAEFFLTEPATDPPGTAIITEFVRMITPQSDGSKLHHVVQLVR